MNKRKGKLLRTLSVTMALVMSISAVQCLPVAAAKALGSETEGTEQVKAPEFLPGDMTKEELQRAVLTEEDTPEVVDEKLIGEKGHVNRLWEQEENLSTIVFQNKDGSKTMYAYAAPVKYKDKNGKVKDKKNKLSDRIDRPELAADYGQTNPENDVRTYFPKTLNKNKGVVLSHEDVKLEVSPLKKKKSAKKEAVTLSLDEQTQAAEQEEQTAPAKEVPGQKKKQNKTDVVEYDKAFGKHTKLRYSATLSGFKEDLILEENIGVNEFSFRVQTNGLSLLKEGEAYYFADPLTGEQVSRVSDILVYDSKDPSAVAEKAEVNPEEIVDPLAYDHHYVLETVEEDQEYILTMVIDEEFLNDPETVYPVTIDPSFTVNGENIQDTTVYSSNYLTGAYNGYLYVGNYSNRFSSTRGIARTLIKVPDLLKNNFMSLDDAQINSVKLFISDMFPDDPQNTIDVYMMNKNWDEYNVICSDTLWNGYDTLVSSRTFKFGNRDYVDGNDVHQYGIDITKAAKAWKNGRTHMGLMLKARDENINARTFGSANGDYVPYIEVQYNPHAISLNTKYSSYLNKGQVDKYYYTLPADTSFGYIVETFGSTDTYLSVKQASHIYTDDDTGEGNNAALGFLGVDWVAGGKPIEIEVRHYDKENGTGSYSIQIRRQRAQVFTFNYGEDDINTIPDRTMPEKWLYSSGYEINDNFNTDSSYALQKDQTGLTRLNSEVFFFSGHGRDGGGAAIFRNGALWDTNLDDMRNTKIAVWSACYSSKAPDSPANHTSLVQASINNGARSAIGWDDTVGVDSAKTFTDVLFKELASGNTVKDSASVASNALLWPWDNGKKYMIGGDENTKIQSVYEINNKAFLASITEIINTEALKKDMQQYAYEAYPLASGGTRYYKTINGLLTNDFYDVTENKQKIIKSKDTILSNDIETVNKKKKAAVHFIPAKEITLGKETFNKITETEQHDVYVKMNNEVIPVRIIYTSYTNKNNIAYQDVTCINLLDDSKINYADICSANN